MRLQSNTNRNLLLSRNHQLILFIPREMKVLGYQTSRCSSFGFDALIYFSYSYYHKLRDSLLKLQTNLLNIMVITAFLYHTNLNPPSISFHICIIIIDLLFYIVVSLVLMFYKNIIIPISPHSKLNLSPLIIQSLYRCYSQRRCVIRSGAGRCVIILIMCGVFLMSVLTEYLYNFSIDVRL